MSDESINSALWKSRAEKWSKYVSMVKGIRQEDVMYAFKKIERLEADKESALESLSFLVDELEVLLEDIDCGKSSINFAISSAKAELKEQGYLEEE